MRETVSREGKATRCAIGCAYCVSSYLWCAFWGVCGATGPGAHLVIHKRMLTVRTGRGASYTLANRCLSRIVDYLYMLLLCKLPFERLKSLPLLVNAAVPFFCDAMQVSELSIEPPRPFHAINIR